MTTAIQSIIRRATRNPEGPWNILTFATHERYESLMCKSGHNFYAIRGPNLKDWNETFAPVPENYQLLPHSNNMLVTPPWLCFDLMLVQSKKNLQFEVGSQIARQLNIPMICLNHMLPESDEEVFTLNSMQGDMNVYVSEYQCQQWNVDPDADDVEVNHTGIDTEMFCPDSNIVREPWALSVVNDWIKRDYCCGFSFWREVTGFPSPAPMIPHKILGDTPGLSQPAPDIATLVDFYRRAGVYLNTTIESSLPTVILEAMACGCPVVSTDTCLIPKIIIEHGVNGFVGSTPDELRRYTHELLNNPGLAQQIGAAGRKTIEEKFSQERFVNKWNEIFHTAVKVIK